MANTDSELPSITGIYPTLANATEAIPFSLGNAQVGEYPAIQNVPYAGIIASVTVKATSGSGTVSVLIAGVALTGVSGVDVDTSENEYLPTDLNYFTVGQDVTLAVISSSSLTNLSVTLGIIRGVTSTATVDPSAPPAPESLSVVEPINIVIPAGETLIPIVFAATKLDSEGNTTANYKINPEPPEDLSGSPTPVISYTVVAKSATGMTIQLSGPVASTTMVIRGTVVTDAADSDVIIGGGSGGGGGSTIASTTLPLRGDGTGGGIAIIQQSGDIATGLVSQNLMVGTPTLAATSLTGTVAPARLGSGSAGAGLLFLADDSTYKAVGTTSTTGTGFQHITSGVRDGAAKLVENADVHASAAIVQSKLSLNGNIPAGWIATVGSSGKALDANDSSIVQALQTNKALAEFNLAGVSLPTVYTNLGLSAIVTKTSPVGTVVGTSDTQVLTNKTIDGVWNTISNIAIASIADSEHTTLALSDPGVDRILFWDDSADTFAFLDGITISDTTLVGLLGVKDASSAAAGDVGELVIATRSEASPISLSTGTAANIHSISLSEGDWDVEGSINFVASAATVTGLQGGINSTSATLPTGGTQVYSGMQTVTTSFNDSVTMPRKRINISSPATVYLVAKATFSAGTIDGSGVISARRVR